MLIISQAVCSQVLMLSSASPGKKKTLFALWAHWPLTIRGKSCAWQMPWRDALRMGRYRRMRLLRYRKIITMLSLSRTRLLGSASSAIASPTVYAVTEAIVSASTLRASVCELQSGQACPTWGVGYHCSNLSCTHRRLCHQVCRIVVCSLSKTGDMSVALQMLDASTYMALIKRRMLSEVLSLCLMASAASGNW
ncbi:hypothetical protein HDV62DRAFT_104691 [Trichoderma sp. SZMC 28011]